MAPQVLLLEIGKRPLISWMLFLTSLLLVPIESILASFILPGGLIWISKFQIKGIGRPLHSKKLFRKLDTSMVSADF